jgi:hypothetical protein
LLCFFTLFASDPEPFAEAGDVFFCGLCLLIVPPIN